MLTATRFALAELDGHTSSFEATTKLADDVFVLGGLQHVIVLEIRAVRLEVAVALVVGFFVGVLEQVELDLAGHHRQEAKRSSGLDLTAQHRARRHLDEFFGVDVVEITHDHRRLRHPRSDADGVPIGGGEHVAIPLLVTGEPIARHRVVIHIAGDEIIAVLGAAFGDLLEEETPGGSLSHEPTL